MTSFNPVGQRALEWIVGPDTGLSSKVIWSVAQGVGADGSRPHDPGDFGRCYRLLELIPEWRVYLPIVAIQCPEWKPLIDIWPELEVMYCEVVRAGAGSWDMAAAKRMYDRMDGLTDACQAAGGWTKTGPGSWQKGGDLVLVLEVGGAKRSKRSKARPSR